MEQTALQRRIRVAAYCRTAVNSDDQINGADVQKAYYTQKISENPDWEMAGIFADVGIASADRKKRVEHNRLVAACKRGEIDMIITKSVSRLARDIVNAISKCRFSPKWDVVFYRAAYRCYTALYTTSLAGLKPVKP